MDGYGVAISVDGIVASDLHPARTAEFESRRLALAIDRLQLSADCASLDHVACRVFLLFVLEEFPDILEMIAFRAL